MNGRNPGRDGKTPDDGTEASIMENSKGYTLVELVVVMAIFIGVIIMTTSAFENILAKVSQQSKSAESQIEGIVGLEMLRYDIEHAGYGLPWSYQTNISVAEASASPVDGVVSPDFNDNPAGAPSRMPRAIVCGSSTTGSTIRSGSSNTNPGVDYLVIKSVLTPLGKSAKRWSYVNYSSQGGANVSYVKRWQSDNDVRGNDRVITLFSTFTATGEMNKRLVMDGSNNFFYKIGTSDPTVVPSNSFRPADPTQMYTVYAIDDANDPLFPYNRADYYVKMPADPKNRPTSCNPGTGILYKGTVVNKTGGGTFAENPLLDCVGDMQVILNLDMDEDGSPGTLASGDGSLVSSSEGAGAVNVQTTLGDASLLRKRLKQVQVYILTHEGGSIGSIPIPPTRWSWARERWGAPGRRRRW